MSESLEDMWKRRAQRTGEGDAWDRKAEQVHGPAAFDQPAPEDAPAVTIARVDLTFSNIFVVVFAVTICQALIGGAALVVLVLVGVI